MRYLVYAWLAVQAAVPFVLKFDPPRFTWDNPRFSWGMYGRLAMDYSVSLSQDRGAAIPGIADYVAGYRSPGWMVSPEGYMSPAEIEARFAALLKAISADRGGGTRYRAVIRWRQPARRTWAFSWPDG